MKSELNKDNNEIKRVSEDPDRTIRELPKGFELGKSALEQKQHLEDVQSNLRSRKIKKDDDSQKLEKLSQQIDTSSSNSSGGSSGGGSSAATAAASTGAVVVVCAASVVGGLSLVTPSAKAEILDLTPLANSVTYSLNVENPDKYEIKCVINESSTGQTTYTTSTTADMGQVPFEITGLAPSTDYILIISVDLGLGDTALAQQTFSTGEYILTSALSSIKFQPRATYDDKLYFQFSYIDENDYFDSFTAILVGEDAQTLECNFTGNYSDLQSFDGVTIFKGTTVTFILTAYDEDPIEGNPSEYVLLNYEIQI